MSQVRLSGHNGHIDLQIRSVEDQEPLVVEVSAAVGGYSGSGEIVVLADQFIRFVKDATVGVFAHPGRFELRDIAGAALLEVRVGRQGSCEVLVELQSADKQSKLTTVLLTDQSFLRAPIDLLQRVARQADIDHKT